jgi:UrcA family protein
MRHPILAGLAVAAFAAAAAPVLAQTTVEELTVIGRYTPSGQPPLSLSRVVDYSDLDLRNLGDQNELKRRVSLAAGDVCRKLGEEAPNAANLGHSCRDIAVRDAMAQVGSAVAYAMARPSTVYAVEAPPPPPVSEGAYADDTTTAAPVAPAASAESYGQSASYTTQTVTNGPVPDTPANRARFGQPMSRAGQHTTASGN